MAEEKKNTGAGKGEQQQDTKQLLKVRREKLENLQADGRDPFKITKFDQTHHTEEAKAVYEAHEKEVLGDRPAFDPAPYGDDEESWMQSLSV